MIAEIKYIFSAVLPLGCWAVKRCLGSKAMRSAHGGGSPPGACRSQDWGSAALLGERRLGRWIPKLSEGLGLNVDFCQHRSLQLRRSLRLDLGRHDRVVDVAPGGLPRQRLDDDPVYDSTHAQRAHAPAWFRKLGFIDYNGGMRVHSALLNVVLYD